MKPLSPELRQKAIDHIVSQVEGWDLETLISVMQDTIRVECEKMSDEALDEDFAQSNSKLMGIIDWFGAWDNEDDDEE